MRREFAAAGEKGIGRQDAGTAGVGDDRQAAAGGAGLLGEDIGHGEQIGDVIDAQHATAAEGGVEDFVAAGEGAGMRGGGFGGGVAIGRL